MTPFIVAEMSCNHLGEFARAMRLVEEAAGAGADGFKVQVWMPDTMCVSRDFTLSHGPWEGERLVDLYRKAFTPWQWLPELFQRARERGMVPFGAAFDAPSVDFLETLGVDRHKVASFEITDLPLLRHMASKGRPMYISTGAARSHHDIAEALRIAPRGSMPVECVSEYPAPPGAFRRLTSTAPWGLSDHSPGSGVAAAAAAHGAAYIEKHLTISRGDGGPDAGFSMDPTEFARMVRDVRDAAATRFHEPLPAALQHRREANPLARSLWVVRDTPRGEPLVLGVNVRTARPALGLPCDTPLAEHGRSAARDLRAGEPLTTECLS